MTSMSLRISTRSEDGIFFVNLEGEIDFYNARALKDVFQKIKTDQEKKVILNLERTSYMDSSAIAVFIDGKDIMKGFGGEVKISGLQDSIAKVFKLIKLDKYFDFYDTDEQARDSFLQGPGRS